MAEPVRRHDGGFAGRVPISPTSHRSYYSNGQHRPVADIALQCVCRLMERDHVAEFKRALVGRRCIITRDTSGWRAHFGDQIWIALALPWRIVTGGRVAFGDQDDGHWFGLSKPVDGEDRCGLLLGGKTVRSIEIDECTGDLRIVFDNDTRLDGFHYSGGYEGWRAGYAVRDEKWNIIAMGGGEIAVVPG